jgi:acyl-homoserine lactone acylase PvdQ
MGGRLATIAAVGAVLALAGPAAAAEQPYGTNDGGGFRNVLPPGTAGTDNAVDLARYQASGQRPPHWDDQQPLYENLLFASPTLTPGDVASYFKDATFGVPDGQVESRITPRPGVTILRDRAYGVPKVYGDTRADVMFGAGYIAGQDRLFLVDVLRHTGRAQLSSFIGGSRSNRMMDREQWALAPYTEADLQFQLDNAERVYGEDGRHAVEDVNNFVAGLNQYVNEALLDPTKLPAEYAAIGKLPEPFTATDLIAEASLIGGIFGKGGGQELPSALTMQAFEDRFGRRAGRRAWRDFRFKNDPEAPVTVDERFPYQTTNPFAARGLALPDRGSVQFTPTGPPLPPEEEASEKAGIGAQLRRALTAKPHASNWELVAARHSASGRPIAVMGPQVGYYVPQILMEQELHGPGIDAAGAAFPGVNLYVQLGHGRDYAWSATSAGSDNVDTFAEVLCQDDFHYMHRGRCLPMEKLERTNTWTPNAVDDSPPGSETLTAYRTVHGIVYARGTVDGQKVAYARARTTYFHEADSAIGFSKLNDPNFVRDAASFQRAVADINFTFNWAYADPEQIAYYQSGAYPVRAEGVSNDFPVLGTGEFDWQNFDTELRTMDQIPFEARPNAIDPDYLVSWNNKQAPRWSSADDQYGYGPIYRSEMIERRVRRGIRDGRKMDMAQLVQAMEEPATQDVRATDMLPVVLRALERRIEPRRRERRRRSRGERRDEPVYTGRAARIANPRLRAAVALLKGWVRRGGHRRDLDRDGIYDDDAAVTLMDAWWPRLLRAQFRPAIGGPAYTQLQVMLELGDAVGGSPAAPAFSSGWWGYVTKDLRGLFGRREPAGAWSRSYCGNGSRRRCQRRLRTSLLASLDPDKAELYGHGGCADDPDAECFDRNRPTVTSGVDMPPFHFQNRPTFQQTVEVERRVPR